MSYRFALERENREDLASGRVLQSAPGFPGFPVRLGSEMFQRALARRGLSRVGVWDPCCGSGQLLTTLGIVHRRQIDWLLGTDVDPSAVALANRNLGLVGDGGLAARATQLRRRADLHSSAGYADRALAAERLARRLQSGGGPLPGFAAVADVFAAAELRRALDGRRPDVVVADLPYGETTEWRGAGDGPPVSAMLRALGAVLERDAVVALAVRGRS